MPCIDWIEIVQVLLNFAIAVAAVSGVWIARRGLNTWRKQQDHDLSKRIFVALQKYRNAISAVRNPVFNFHEVDKDPQATFSSRYYQSLEQKWLAQWESLKNARAVLDSELLEATAAWGDRLNERFVPVNKLETELRECLNRHLFAWNPDVEYNLNDGAKEWFKNPENRNVVAFNVADGDPYGEELDAAIKPIETYLRNKMPSTKRLPVCKEDG